MTLGNIWVPYNSVLMWGPDPAQGILSQVGGCSGYDQRLPGSSGYRDPLRYNPKLFKLGNEEITEFLVDCFHINSRKPLVRLLYLVM